MSNTVHVPLEGVSAGHRTYVVCVAQPYPESCCHISCVDLGLNFHPCVLQITAYNRRTFETARHNLVINIMATEGKRRQRDGLKQQEIRL